MNSQLSIRWVLTVVPVIFIVIVLMYIIPTYLHKSVSPIDVGITNETVFSGDVYRFKEGEFKVHEFLLFVQLETNTKLNELKPEEKAINSLSVKTPSWVDYQYFDLTFNYETDEGIKRVPDGFIKNVLMTFKVDKTRLKKKGLEKYDLKLSVYNKDKKAWINNSADFLREEGNDYIYQAGSLYHGLFAIVG